MNKEFSTKNIAKFPDPITFATLFLYRKEAENAILTYLYNKQECASINFNARVQRTPAEADKWYIADILEKELVGLGYEVKRVIDPISGTLNRFDVRIAPIQEKP